MLAAGIDAARIAEGAVLAVVLAAVLAIVTIQISRWRRRRKVEHVDPGTPALARFIDTAITDGISFGGGAWSARVNQRVDTVTYGYLAVAEEYHSDDTGGRWCTLTVTLPGRVPFLVVDNRATVGRSGVPLETAARVTLDDPPFDATYTVGATADETISRVLSPAARDVLLRAPVQRLMLHDTQLLLRTFDGVTLDDDVIKSLDSIAARFLASTPSFVTAVKAPARSNGAPPDSAEPLPEGFYGPDAE